jgi:hypothetical protein
MLKLYVPNTSNHRASCPSGFLKFALTSSPILIYPCLEKEFILDTDASGTGTRAVLSQIGDDGREHVIAYYSKSTAGS